MVIAEHAASVRRAQDVFGAQPARVVDVPVGTALSHLLWDSCFTAIGIARYDAPRAPTSCAASARVRRVTIVE
jgi:hypothetical protein